MSDDPTKNSYQDRDRVTGDQDYEVRYFAEQNSISSELAREPIKKPGNMRVDLEREARKISS